MWYLHSGHASQYGVFAQFVLVRRREQKRAFFASWDKTGGLTRNPHRRTTRVSFRMGKVIIRVRCRVDVVLVMEDRMRASGAFREL